jgi:hypothetical protein
MHQQHFMKRLGLQVVCHTQTAGIIGKATLKRNILHDLHDWTRALMCFMCSAAELQCRIDNQ